MVAIGVRILIFLVIVYVGLAAIIFFQQGKFIFPAPQTVHPPALTYQAVTLKTADGLSLTAHWHAPQADKPVVMHFHGNAGDLSGATAENQFLAQQGYGVLLVEYRGYGGNPGTPSETGFREDGRAALAFLKDRSIEPDRIIIKGHSIGSGTAVNMASELDAAALILVAPFTSIPDLLMQKMPIFPMRLLVNERFDNRAKLRNLTMPILVQHGMGDTVIPVSHGRALSDASPNALFQSFEGAGHELTLEPEVQAAQIEWLASLGL
ncbi:MAG: alpha/beta fold hydrolase [Pseudomonadota bacterium]